MAPSHRRVPSTCPNEPETAGSHGQTGGPRSSRPLYIRADGSKLALPKLTVRVRFPYQVRLGR
jgi:hypothetical protein